MIYVVRLVCELGLADGFHDGIDECADLLDLLMRHHDGIVHFLIGHFLCARLDHDHLLGSARNGHSHAAPLALFCVGVDHELTVHQSHNDRSHGTVPRNIGNGKCNGRTQKTDDLRLAIRVDAHDRQVDHHIVAQILGEERTGGAVNDTGREDSFFGRTSLALIIAAGNSAHGVQALFKVYRQRQEVDAVARTLACGGGCKYDGLTVPYQAGAVCKACHFAGLHDQRPTRKFILEGFVILKHSFHFLRIYTNIIVSLLPQRNTEAEFRSSASLLLHYFLIPSFSMIAR